MPLDAPWLICQLTLEAGINFYSEAVTASSGSKFSFLQIEYGLPFLFPSMLMSFWVYFSEWRGRFLQQPPHSSKSPRQPGM